MPLANDAKEITRLNAAPSRTGIESTTEGEPLVDALHDISRDADAEDIADSVSSSVRYAKLYDVQHWRTSTARYLDGTVYGYEPETPPLSQEQFRELPSVTYHAVVGAIAGGLAGERIAFECSAALCAYAPDDNARMFLATQVIDEARHVEVFTQRLKSLGKHDIDDTLHRYVNPRMFRFHDEMRQRVCDSRDFAGGVVGQNLALEGLALGFFEFNASLLRDIDPGTSHILDTVLLDERRHVGFGLVRLRELCQEDSSKRAYVEDTVAELSGDMMEIFEENADNMSRLGLDPAPAMERVRWYHQMHLRKLGLTDTL
jgi:ribonucleotide reductase beta subunit family protein with ferritin-like domain